MRIFSNDFEHGEWMPCELAYGRLKEGRFALSDNLNPHLRFSGVPAETKSLVLTCIDPDVPTDREALNNIGEIDADQPRRDFVHWLVWDMSSQLTEIARGDASIGDSTSGKRFAKPMGVEGLNDYTRNGEVHRGYDGPCPPGTDARLHGYEFRLFALDVESLNLPDTATWVEVSKKMAPHVLASAMIQGIYSLNPRLQPKE